MEYTKALADLIEEFNKFPGVGPKSAQRMAFALLKKSNEQNQRFLEVARRAKNEIKQCSVCFNLSSDDICEICTDTKRQDNLICVVEEVKDLIAIEKTKEFRGKYHVLGGLISPLDGISSADLNVEALLERIKSYFNNLNAEGLSGADIQGLHSSKNLSLLNVNDNFENKHNAEDQPLKDPLELVFAISPSTEGEATMLFLKKMIGKLDHSDQIIMSRLAYGLPLGADLDYADELTIVKALEARVSLVI
ncbi:MAG: recombination protein RecR [Candidatus Caenarcaniphilales bacterium]|nr:recombination protein RecR [Candidatus Caenarcaniphilales bacterium]